MTLLTAPLQAPLPRRDATLDDPRLERAFARIADSDLRLGNAVELLRDARENYPAWLAAIRSAKRVIHFENFIIADDETGRLFAEALMERARAGVRVRVLCDWLGSSFRALPPFWRRLRASGVEARIFNPPRLTNPLWMRRDHRKLITVDGRIGFVSGLCISDSWHGKNGAPWRDTGVVIEGPVVADLDRTFSESWTLAGMPPIPKAELSHAEHKTPAGEVAVRVISGRPGMFRTYRMDQFIAAAAQRNLWLTDAYFVATASYVQALAEAARDGVDVRLLVPGSSDIPLLQAIARSGYRSLIEAGIRVFEWNGPMLHAKTAVADGCWARVGSTNLNLASWATNWELDIVVENAAFGQKMEAMYLEDLANATEIIPGWQARLKRAKSLRSGRTRHQSRSGVRQLAAGALSLGASLSRAVGARSLTATEARSAAIVGFALLAIAVLMTLFPVLIVSPVVIALAWLAAALLIRAFRLNYRLRLRRRKLELRRRLAEARQDDKASSA